MLILSRAEVEQLLDPDLLIERLADGFIQVSAGNASVPPRVAAFAPGGFLGAMPGYVANTLEAKLVSVFPGNNERGQPSHHALIALFDPHTGAPLAVMDGEHITAMRTAGASALATRVLAHHDASILAVIGAGVQGRAHLEMVRRVRSFPEVRIASRNYKHAGSLATEVDATPVETYEEAVRGAHVLCLCTNSSTPLITREWLEPGTHVTSVGANPQGGEVDLATVRAGLVVVESRVALQPPPAGAYELQGLDPEEVVELGEVLAGDHPGRTSDDQLTVYKSMGHAVEDAVAASLVYERAVREQVGTHIEI